MSNSDPGRARTPDDDDNTRQTASVVEHPTHHTDPDDDSQSEAYHGSATAQDMNPRAEQYLYAPTPPSTYGYAGFAPAYDSNDAYWNYGNQGSEYQQSYGYYQAPNVGQFMPGYKSTHSGYQYQGSTSYQGDRRSLNTRKRTAADAEQSQDRESTSGTSQAKRLRGLKRHELTCKHCHQKRHNQRDCIIPADDGFVHGCPRCQTMEHDYDDCPEGRPDKKNFDDKFYVVETRDGKAPLYTRIDPTSTEGFWKSIFRPHTPGYAAKLVADGVYQRSARYGQRRQEDQRIRDPAWKSPDSIPDLRPDEFQNEDPSADGYPVRRADAVSESTASTEAPASAKAPATVARDSMVDALLSQLAQNERQSERTYQLAKDLHRDMLKRLGHNRSNEPANVAGSVVKHHERIPSAGAIGAPDSRPTSTIEPPKTNPPSKDGEGLANGSDNDVSSEAFDATIRQDDRTVFSGAVQTDLSEKGIHIRSLALGGDTALSPVANESQQDDNSDSSGLSLAGHDR